MGFRIVEGCPKVGWFPASCATAPTANTFYIGQLVQAMYDGVFPLKAAVAKPEVASFPFGVVLGFNVQPGDQSYDSTYKTEKAASVITQATLLAKAGKVAFTEGMMHKNELQLMVKVGLIRPDCTVLEGPICKTAFGTAPTVVTCTTADTDGLTGMVHGASDAATGNNVMYYCRTGNNQGVYRMSYASSTTTPTFYSPWPYVWTVGDTFVVTNIGIGRQYVEFGTAGVGMFIENGDNLTHAFVVNVHSMNLEMAGQETVQFAFASHSAI